MGDLGELRALGQPEQAGRAGRTWIPARSGSAGTAEQAGRAGRAWIPARFGDFT